MDFELINALTGQQLASQRFTGTAAALRNAAHRVSDVVYEKILGIRGAFATRIAYVSVDGQPPNQRYQLIVADADGENPRIVLESRFPLMSPVVVGGRAVARVRVVRRAPLVRSTCSGCARVSGRAFRLAPASTARRRSRRMARSWRSPWAAPTAIRTSSCWISGATGTTRITDDPAIDTEAVWSTDGQSLYFTSDRAGGPQIYRVAPRAGERPKRITFGGSYNARPRLSPDGTQLAMVTLDGGNYRIAVQDLANNNVRVLSKGRQDESPSFAPNGAMVIYSGSEGGRSLLATVSTDGLTGQRLKSDQGQVREPVWGSVRVNELSSAAQSAELDVIESALPRGCGDTGSLNNA